MSRVKFQSLFIVLFAGLVSCNHENHPVSGYIKKDLSEQMDALQVYQGSIGEEIKKGKPGDALWLVEGMDSVMQMIMERQNEHKNLKKPFSDYYESKMERPIGLLKMAIKDLDTSAAHRAYRILVRNCNSCHNEHDVEERAHY